VSASDRIGPLSKAPNPGLLFLSRSRNSPPPAAGTAPASTQAPAAPRSTPVVSESRASPAAVVPADSSWAGYVDEDGEEEGVMDIGVPASEAEMVTYIPGMKDMTPEQYQEALNAKVVKNLREVRPLVVR
jgi:hypothetical protein